MNHQDSQLHTFSEVQLSYKKKQYTHFENIRSSHGANTILRSIFPAEQIIYREYMYALYLNNSNQVIGYHLISIGGLTGTVADTRILLQGALMTSATSIILCHNHPSGTVKPSEADKAITTKIKKACEYHDIVLLDHIILTENSYFSFEDDGAL